MNIQTLGKHITCTLVFIFSLTVSGNCQMETIGLIEAFDLAKQNYAGLERDRLAVNQQSKLAQTGLPLQPTQISISGEEFGVNNQRGIHSLNVQQVFYLPKASRVQKAYFEKSVDLAEKQLSLTEYELKGQVEQAYFQVLFSKEEKQLVAEHVRLYEDFLTITTARLERGETGKIPQLAARSHLGQAQLEMEHASEKYQIALNIFNQWLQSDTTYDAEGSLPSATQTSSNASYENVPMLELIEAQKELVEAKLNAQKVQLQPQIISGLKLQTADGNFPLFGYQIGVNVPLSKKAYNGRIEAAKLGVMVVETDFKAKEQELDRKISQLKFQLDHQLHILEYLQDDLIPIVREQSDANLKAYREGEINYLEYLDGLSQVVKVKEQYLEALYEYHVLRIEMNYWLGR